MTFISSLWSIPFLGIIFSMSFLPVLCPNFWNKYASYVSLFWSTIYLFFVCCFFGISKILPAIFEPIFADYIPF
ncbi:MAG: sodium:proton antiporter, partial [Holosporaceae bacterium]|nr:sodium:proton antiporter [Holosporaceae bacterium]